MSFLSPDRNVRGLFWAVRVPMEPAPFDTIHLTVRYPAVSDGSDAERLSGTFAADPARTPLPIVIIAPGVNVSPDAYRWLAERLAANGCAVVTYTWVGELFGGTYGITPGLDVTAVTPDTYGTRPTFNALAPLLDALGEINDGDGPLGQALDLSRVVLGGHSAGGTVVLQSADKRWCPALAAVFTYGAHTMASTALGWDVGTVLPITGDVPVLLAGGSDDGVIAGSAMRYGESAHDRVDPILRTFDQAVPGGRGDAYLFTLDGANHFAAVDPHDHTIARGFLDAEPRRPVEESRTRFGDLVVDFVTGHVLGDHQARVRLDALVKLPPPDLALARAK